jgi:hypothetical protein
MVNGIMALQHKGGYTHLNRKYAERLVDEALEVVSISENNWMSAHELLGLAVNESDLVSSAESGPPAYADCGVAQNHIALFEKTYSGRRALCKRLKKSTRLSLEYAMKELNMVRTNWCLKYIKKPAKRKTESDKRFKYRMDNWETKQYRCLLNVYNQGPRFLFKTCEQQVDKNKYTTREYSNRLYKCRWRGMYWLRSKCFSTGINLGRRPTKVCRGALGVQWINKVYNIK